jgi:hypothetical protein
MDVIKKVFSGYSREDVCDTVKIVLDMAKEERFIKGGFWIYMGKRYAEDIQLALEKHMRLPYTYYYDLEHGRWRVNIVHMPK